MRSENKSTDFANSHPDRFRGSLFGSRQRILGGLIDPDEPAHGYELERPSPEKESSGRLAVFVEDLPRSAPPMIRKFIETYGGSQIISARLCRVPIKQQSIIKLGNIITLGNLERKRKELQSVFGGVYDDVFHLYVDFTIVMPDRSHGHFKIEKNEKVEIRKTDAAIAPDFRGNLAACISQPPTRYVTVSEMFKRAEQGVGPEALWRYNLAGTNCQAFAIALLGNGNGMLTPAGKAFALQDVKYLLPKWIATVAKGGTDLANRLKSFMYGQGL